MSYTLISFKDVLLSSGSFRIKLIKTIDYIVGSLLAQLVPAKNKTLEPASLDPKRILVIRPGGIGDAIFLLPILRRIKEVKAGICIDVLCEKRNAIVFSSQEGICDHVYCYDSLKSFSTLWHNSYDVIIDSEQWHYLSALVSYFLSAQYSVGFGSRPLRTKLLNHPVDYDINEYELKSFQKLFTKIFPSLKPIDSLNASFHVDQDSLSWAKNKVKERSVSLFLGGSLPEKYLPLDKAIEVIKFVIGQGYQAVLLGGKDIVSFNQQIENKVSDKRLLNLTGQTSLSQSAATISLSKLFVGTDSGLLHLARAVGTPTVAIFGSTNPKKWGATNPQNIIIADNLPDAAYSKFSYSSPSYDGSSLNKLDTERIISAMKELLNK